MEINKFTTYSTLTDLIQKCVESAREDSCECTYIKGIDSYMIDHIVDVFIDSCNFNQLCPIFQSTIPDSVIKPDRVCGLGFQCYTDIGVNSMILTIY